MLPAALPEVVRTVRTACGLLVLAALLSVAVACGLEPADAVSAYDYDDALDLYDHAANFVFAAVEEPDPGTVATRPAGQGPGAPHAFLGELPAPRPAGGTVGAMRRPLYEASPKHDQTCEGLFRARP